MAVRRWDPFRDLLTIQNEMNRLFGRTYGPGESAEAETQGTWVPPLDVYETEERYIITAELAGMTTADIDRSESTRLNSSHYSRSRMPSSA